MEVLITLPSPPHFSPFSLIPSLPQYYITAMYELIPSVKIEEAQIGKMVFYEHDGEEVGG
jgi:hypothetical protein